MSIYAKDIKKAPNCIDCRFSRFIARPDGQKLYCYAANKFTEPSLGISSIVDYSNCPFAEITAKGRLIDADRLLAVIKSAAGDMESVPLSAVLDSIENAPTVLEADRT